MAASHDPTATEPCASLRTALSYCRYSFLTAGFISFFINLLGLVPMVYMMQVYDRVMTSSSLSTLTMLTVLLVFLLTVMGILEWIRSQILVITSNRLEQLLNARVFDAMFHSALATSGHTASAQPVSDLLNLRQFLTGAGLFAFFDAPWLPLNIIVMWWFHWTFGVVALVSSLILLTLNLWTELATRDELKKASEAAIESGQHTQRNLRNIEVIESMGMLDRLRARWQQQQATIIGSQSKASARAGFIASLSKLYRTIIQSLILGLGAYLAIDRQISPGSMIAGSMLLGRALAPLDLLIGSWKGFVSARDAYGRLDRLLKNSPPAVTPMALPPPTGQLSLQQVTVVPFNSRRPILANVSLTIEAGQQVAIIGPSGAGKSTLLRTMLGLYRLSAGSVRLDGAEISQWDRADLGQYIGFLPQDVELLDGSIGENIARFGEIDAEAVIAAARLAGIHEMLLSLPDGYDTWIQGQGSLLSAGQRQRLGLARALYRSPRLLLLDEPNSNLDQEGDNALAEVLASLRASSTTVIVVTHRPNLLGQVDCIAFVREGQLAAYGPRDDILKAILAQPAPPGLESTAGAHPT